MDDGTGLKPLRVVQFTDTHFFGTSTGALMGVDTAATFEEVKLLAAQNFSKPDFYLLTGDLSQDETEQSYERFADSVKDFEAPTYFLPGNHDVRSRMERLFCESGAPFKNDVAFTIGSWHVILLDTHVEGQVAGNLAPSELERLEDELSKSEQNKKHALIVLHHHPVPVHSAWIDKIGVKNGADFLAILSRHANVRAVLFGHIHQEFEQQKNGVHFMASPSTCVQFKPRQVEFAVDNLPPGFRWLVLNPDGTVESQVVRALNVAAGLDMDSKGY